MSAYILIIIGIVNDTVALILSQQLKYVCTKVLKLSSAGGKSIKMYDAVVLCSITRKNT